VLEKDIEIINKLGLHARAAAKLVKLASGFDCNIDIQKEDQRVNAKSIMGVMMLAASRGNTVTVSVQKSGALNQPILLHVSNCLK